MALSFFRRRQKMVVIVMVALMVSFLIGFQGMQMLFKKGADTHVYGQTKEGEITLNQLKQASAELEYLLNHVGLGNPRYLPPTQRMLDMDVAYRFLRSNGNDNDNVLAYVLLQQEAKSAGIAVSNLELNLFFEEIGLSGEYYANRVAEVRERPGITEKHFRSIAARWLMAYKAFESANVNTPPSIQELRQVYRDTAEKIKLRVLRIQAANLLEDVPKEVAEEELQKHFEKYRGAIPGQYLSADSFGFGYMNPHRVAIAYLFIDEATIKRVTRPQEKRIGVYYRANKESFKKRVPLTKSTDEKPSTQPPADSTSKPAEFEMIQMSYAEARPKIIKTLTDDLVKSRIDEMASLLDSM